MPFNTTLVTKKPQEKAKITPQMVLSYTSHTLFYYLTFQFDKARKLDVDYKKKLLEQKSFQEVVETSNEDLLKTQKRIEKLKDSTTRIDKLSEFVKYSKNTIYENQILDIFNVTSQIHLKYKNDVDLNIYKLEQFHTYHTDPFIKLIDDAFSDIKNIKILKVEPKPVINNYTLKPIDTTYHDYDPDSTLEYGGSMKDCIMPYDDKYSSRYNKIDKDIFDLAQSKLLSLRDTLIITPATNADKIETILDTYKHMYFFKQNIYNEMKNEEYVYIGKITERDKLIYFCFINRKQDKLVQYNVLTDFPRVIKLNK